MKERIFKERSLRFWMLPFALMLALLISFPAHAETEMKGRENASKYQVADKTFATKYKTQIAEIRKHLTDHDSEFSVDFTVTESVNVDDKFAYSLYYYACEHTGDPSQGDYIYMQNKGCSWLPSQYVDSNGKQHFVLKFSMKYFTTKAQEASAEKKAKAIIKYLKLDKMSDYDKILNIYSYLCENVKYDQAGLEDESTDIEHSAYAALCKGKAVCQGYAAALYKLMLMAGIDCRIITGKVNYEAHGWNIVKLNGKYYYVDATFDALRSEYLYFMKNQAAFADHHLDDEFLTAAFKKAYPIATSSLGEKAVPPTRTTKGYTYRLSLDGLTIYSYSGDEKDVVVPAKLAGVPVKTVSKDTFFRNDSIRSITISEGIELIEPLFAESCSALKKISIPSTAGYGYRAPGIAIGGLGGLTAVCDELASIKVAKGNPYLCTVDGILYNAAKTSIIACPIKLNAEIVRIPKGVKSITDGCFEKNPYIRQVVLPSTITYIGYWAFAGATNLEKINLPAGVNFVGQFAFERTKLKTLTIPKGFEGDFMPDVFYATDVKVTVEKGNKKFKMVNDCLIQDGTYLIYYCHAAGKKTCVVPKGVTVVCMSAFEHAMKLQKVVLQEGVIRVAERAFTGCIGMKEIVLPDSLETIDEEAFAAAAVDKIRIPKNVKSIGNNAFHRNTMKGITIDPKNKNFITVNGLTYTRDKKRLLFGNATNMCCLKLPDTLEQIDTCAMADVDCSEVVLPKSLETVNPSGLHNSNIRKIYVPKGIKAKSLATLGSETVICYEGTKAQWNITSVDGLRYINVKYNVKAPKSHTLKHKAVTVPAKKATCTKGGLTKGSKCAACGKVLKEQKETKALGHKKVVDRAVKATGKKTGLTKGVHCSRCGKVLVKQKKIPKLKGWTKQSGKWYYYAKGKKVTGWKTISGKKYYFKKNGAAQTGWKTFSGKKYYFSKKGLMLTGLKTISGKNYYFNKKGVMQTGWMKISGEKYYFKKNGAAVIGWKKLSGKWYYFDVAGRVLTGRQMINGVSYNFDKNGVLIGS